MAFAIVLSFSFCIYSCAAEEKTVYRHVATEEKVVALTFDDGPHPKYTEIILDLLSEYDAKATFFIVGENLELYGDSAKRAVMEGHEIGNHTYSHPTLSGIGLSELSEEIRKNEDLIMEKLGVRPVLFRPPEGFCGDCVRSFLKENGYRAILWDVDTRDWAGTASDKICKTVLSGTHPGSIILFHDYVGKQNTTIAALRTVLPLLKDAGYRFVTVSELLAYAS